MNRPLAASRQPALKPLRPLTRSLWQLRQRIWMLLLLNVISLLLSLPCAVLIALVPVVPQPPGGFIVTGMLLILLSTPTAAGLHAIVHDLARDEHPFLSDFWIGLREYGPLALRAWLLGVAGTAIILANIEYYGRVHFFAAPFLEIVWLYLLLLWSGVQLYVYPLVFEQEQKRVLLVYRNAVVLAATYRLFTALVTGIWLLGAFLCTISMLLVFLGLALCAGIQHNAAEQVLRRRAEALA